MIELCGSCGAVHGHTLWAVAATCDAEGVGKGESGQRESARERKRVCAREQRRESVRESV